MCQWRLPATVTQCLSPVAIACLLLQCYWQRLLHGIAGKYLRIATARGVGACIWRHMTKRKLWSVVRQYHCNFYSWREGDADALALALHHVLAAK